VDKGVGGVDVPVERLRDSEARSLARTLLGGQNCGELAEVIAQESGGSPFFIYELIQHFQTAGPAPGRRTLREVLWERVTHLPAEARRLLEVLAVAGQPLRQAEAIAAAAMQGPPHAPLALLRSGRYTRGTGSSNVDRIEVYHDRIRETVVARLTDEQRGTVHGRLAQTLEAVGGADPEVLGVHFEGAGQRDRASHYYALAAAAAGESLAFDRSARLYRQALALHAPAGEDGQRLRAQLALALANAGRSAEAAREYLAAATGAGRDEVLHLKRSAADQFLRSGHIDEGLALLREVLASLGLAMPASPRRALVGLLYRRALLWLRGLRFQWRREREIPPEELRLIDTCWMAGVTLTSFDPVQGAYFNIRHLLLALRAGEPSRVARALALEAAHLASTGNMRFRRVEPLFRTAEELACQVEGPYARGFVLMIRAVAAGPFGRWRLFNDLATRAEEYLRASCTGVAWELDHLRRYFLWSLVNRGEVAELQRRLPLLLREARERGNLYGETIATTFAIPFLRLAEDDPTAARRELRQSIDRWSRQAFHWQHLTCLLDEVQIDLYLGEAQAAWNRLRTQWGAVTRSLLLRVQQFRILMYHLRARAAVAVAATSGIDPNPFLRAAQDDCRRLEREMKPWPVTIALLVRAGIAAVRGERTPAAALLRDVAERLDARDMPLHAAAARRQLGKLLGSAEGRALVEQADTEFRNRSIVNPVRMTAMLAPGFPD
jgi:hypothetical protein